MNVLQICFMGGLTLGAHRVTTTAGRILGPDAFARLLKQAKPAKRSQAGLAEGKLEFSPPFWPASQMSQNGSFVRKPFYPREMVYS